MFESLLVIEFSGVLAGPAVGMFMAELGARVIKVEPPGGDVTRFWKLASEPPEGSVSAYFSSVNWGKESLCLDLKNAEGRASALRLCRRADVVISNFLPGAAARLGLGAETLMAANPRLICAEINGYGADQPRAAYDAIIQAEAGFTYMNGSAEAGIFKMPVALMDLLAAHQLKEALLLALIRRMQTGAGSRVSVSLIGAGIASLANQAANWLVAGEIPQPIGSEHPNIAPYGTIFSAAAGQQLVLAVGNDTQFAALCEVLGISDWEDYASPGLRVRNRQALNAMLQAAIAAWPRQGLLQALQRRQVPAGAVHNLPEVMELPQAQALLLSSGAMRGLRSFAAQAPFAAPVSLSPPPVLGAHTQAIIEEFQD